MSENKKKVEISSLMHRLENDYKNQVRQGVVLNCVLGATKCPAMLDAEFVERMFIYLLDNACRNTQAGFISFGYSILANQLMFEVKDSGTELTPEEVTRLTTQPDDGQPNSLIHMRAKIEERGGSAGIELGRLGHGATFWFALPYEPVAEQEASTFQPTGAPAAPQPVAAPQPATEFNKTILVVEDIESNYAFVRSMLEKKFRLVRARDGQEGIDMYKQYNPDLVLMDIYLPIKDGYQATAEIRQISQTVPIIAVTAYAFATDRKRILDSGFNGYVSKPINIQRLEREINTHLFGGGGEIVSLLQRNRSILSADDV